MPAISSCVNKGRLSHWGARPVIYAEDEVAAAMIAKRRDVPGQLCPRRGIACVEPSLVLDRQVLAPARDQFGQLLTPPSLPSTAP